MNYKILFISFVLILTSCSIETSHINKDKLLKKNAFKNNGFTLVYSESLYKKKKLFLQNLMIEIW